MKRLVAGLARNAKIRGLALATTALLALQGCSGPRYAGNLDNASSHGYGSEKVASKKLTYKELKEQRRQWREGFRASDPVAYNRAKAVPIWALIK